MTSTILTNLLPEILDLILTLFLVTSDPIIIPIFFGCFSPEGFDMAARPKPREPLGLQPSILHVCKAIHEAGTRSLYQKNRFHFQGPQGLYTFAATIGKSNAQLVSQISIHAVNPEFFRWVLDGRVTACFKNLNRITLDRRGEGRGVVARSLLRKIPNKEELEKALREQVGPGCHVSIFPAE